MRANLNRIAGVLVLATLGGGFLAGCGSSGSNKDTASIDSAASASVSLAPASFSDLPAGWRALDGEGAPLTERGAMSESFATSWDFDPASGRGPAGALPDHAAFVTVSLFRRASGGASDPSLCSGVAPTEAYPTIEPGSFRLDDMRAGSLEGRSDVPEYVARGTVDDDYHVEVRVDINARSSGAEVRREAQEVLDGLSLPHWGNHC